MKWLIASDIHGSARYCGKLADRFDAEGAERLLLLGDLLYHGPRNALPPDYATVETARILNGLKERILCVRGNCDAEVDQAMLEFPIMADYSILEMAPFTVFATHGHRYNTQSPPPRGLCSVLLHGHTHVPACEDHGTYVYLNPGSVSIPKGFSRNSYMTFEAGVFRWKTLDGTEYKSYSAGT